MRVLIGGMGSATLKARAGQGRFKAIAGRFDKQSSTAALLHFQEGA